MSTIEDNKLIVEFIGIDPKHADEYGFEFIKPLFGSHQRYYDWDHVKFHSSWDWLMTVVEKIESLPNVDFIIGKFHICIEKENYGYVVYDDLFKGNKIENVCEACVVFIKWYNENHPNEQN